LVHWDRWGGNCTKERVRGWVGRNVMRVDYVVYRPV
jgi:hypothetical protein